MKIQRIRIKVFDRLRMQRWREAQNIPKYVDASYIGPTGAKEICFPRIKSRAGIPNITEDVRLYEEEILQELKDTRKQTFGYIKALWKMSQNLSTGEPWDSKFMPQFPGRDKYGQVQYAKYKGTIVSANDLSNIIYGHICGYMKIPAFMAKMIARLDACGALEIITKRKLPSISLLKFKDTSSDQTAIARGVKEFNIKNYRLQ